MTRTTGHARAQLPLGVTCGFLIQFNFTKRCVPYSVLLDEAIEQTAFSTIASPSLFGFQVSCSLEIGDRPFDGGFRESEILGDCMDGGIALALPVGSVP